MSNFRESLYKGTHKKLEWEEDLKYLYEIIKNLYKVEAKDEYGNVIIDEETKEPKLVDSLRRSGRPKYTHPYNVAAYLYNKGYSREYIITALFHDVLEDTKYTEEHIKKILLKYVDLYPDAVSNDQQEFIDTVINAVNCVTKQGKISRPNAPKLELSDKTVDQIKTEYNTEIKEITVHELLDKKQITINIGGTLKRIPKKELNISLTDKSQEELKKYTQKLLAYKAKMPDYINGIKESENDIAKIVKVADRISNLTDFSPTDNSNWLEKYIRETEDYFLDLASGTDLEQDFIKAINIATLTQTVKGKHEHGDKGELII